MENEKPDLSKYDKGVFMVNTLGVIFNPSNKKILIGKRENDKFVKNLEWGFPGGRPNYGEDLEESLRRAFVDRRASCIFFDGNVKVLTTASKNLAVIKEFLI